jgi:hypothetical protein
LTYQIVDNFIAGLDTRKSPLTSAAGTLTRLINAAISPGGEIVKRRAFVQVADVTGSFGFAATESSLYVFGHNVVPTLPSWSVPGVALKGQKLINQTATDYDQTDYDTFDGKIYVVGYSPSSTYPQDNQHYYDGVKTEGTGKGFYVRTFQSKVYTLRGSYLYFSTIGNPMIWDPALAAAVGPTGVTLHASFPTTVQVPLADISKFRNLMRVQISGATNTGMTVANGEWQIFSVNATAGTFVLINCDTRGGTSQTSGVTINPVASTGSGYINLSMQDADSEYLTSLEVYYDKLAIFASSSTQIWGVDPDPLQNAYIQLLRGSGTNAARSPLQYGNGDVLYLDQSGVRSLKARDSSNSASVSDIGSPIDPTVQAMVAAKGAAYMNKAISLLEPSVGRFWIVFEDQVLVLSYFPGPKITAWSVYTLPEIGTAKVKFAVTCGGKVFFRTTDDKIYVYGGADGNAVNNCGVEVRLPYLDGKKPGHKKLFAAVDATVSYDYDYDTSTQKTGAWRIAVSFDPANPEAEETIATIDRPTWNIGASELQGYDSHFSLRFYNNDTLPVTLSNCAVHYELADTED